MNKLYYTEDEIVVMYDQARHKGEQIKILAELNIVDKKVIIEILQRRGRDMNLPDVVAAMENRSRKSREVVYQRYKRLVDAGYTVEEISQRLNTKASSVREYLRNHELKTIKKTAP